MEKRESILIIDDSAVQADMLRSILIEDYEITIVNTAEEGLRLARAGDFSLVLLDVIMPGMDGFQLLKALQEEGYPITGITVWGMNDDLSWRTGEYGLLFDGDMNPKKAYLGALLDPSVPDVE